ncbi:MAG: DNA-binding protein [Candidatus Thermoplasmatota archaeon]|jgi:programmed cell death protein 5|nr:DNA-binding protein [Candidatus Thermoplasmatota archaeon]MCL5665778.1 DNA-binding protein [Candidatus Thermoplasmatota archaeon]
MDSDDEIEEIRRRKLQEMQNAAAEEQMAERQRQAQELEKARKQQILRQILTPEARERLGNVKLVRPDIAENVENQLIQLANMGRINRVVSDSEIREILDRFTPRKETRIERRNK